MERFKFFLEGVEANRHLDIDWILGVVTLSEYPFSDEMIDWQPYDIAKDRTTGRRVFFDPVNDNTFTTIEGIGDLDPIIDYKAMYKLQAGQLPNLKESITTTGGTLILNLYCLILPFKDKIPYVNKKMKPSDLNDPVAHLLASDQITIDEYLYYCECVGFLGNFWGVSVPTGSKRTMTVSPAVIAMKDKLLKDHASELDNNVVMTNIENQLIALDKEEFKDDVARDFFINDKSRATSRKKAKIIVGLDDGLGGGKPSLITRSFQDGMKVEDIPSAADSTRAASYSRGFLTAQGGELVNYLYRVFMNTKITVDDCGTKYAIPTKITKDNMKRYIDRFQMDKSGKSSLLEENTVKGLINQTILIRSPGRCKEKAPNFCAMCTDRFFFQSRETVHIETSLPGSIIMNDRMKAMHGRAYKIAFFEPTIHLT